LKWNTQVYLRTGKMLTIMMTMVNISITSYKSLTIKRLAKA